MSATIHRHAPPGDRFRRRLLLLVVGLLLVLFWGTVVSLVVFFRQARGEMEAMHKQDLYNAALAAAYALSSGDVLESLRLDPGAEAEAWLLLSRLCEETGAADLRLYDAMGGFLLGLVPSHDGMESFDQAELWSAEAGLPAFTPPQAAAGLYFQTLYFPIKEPLTDDVRGIVAVQGNVRFEETLAPLRAWATLLVVANGGVVVLLLAFFWWAQRRMAALEAEQRAAERLAALGGLAAGVAHELRNPLGIIGQAVTLLRKKYDPDEGDRFFDYIPAEVARMNGLLKEFLSLTREQPLQLADTDLSRLAETVRERFAGECAARKVEFLHLADGPAPCRLDADRMVQVGLNLVVNALDAMPEGGRLTSRVGRAGREVFWSLADTGVGIAPEHLPRLTEAFYTTKPEGAGLGLAIVEKLVRQHGGRLQIESRPGQGATFTLFFPRSA